MCLPAARPRLADLLGIGLSLTCLAHCLALPLAILLAPALGRWITLPEGVHAAILLLALPAALIAMSDGWRSHRRMRPAVFATIGLSLLAAGLGAHEGWVAVAVADAEATDRLLTTAGALGLAAAHWLNWRSRHCGDK